jgi:diguanylate cyclase (GGDEF)-like protein
MSESMPSEVVKRLENRLKRERRRREQLELFAEQKTRQLFKEKEKWEIAHQISSAVFPGQSLLAAMEQIGSVLIDFKKVDGCYLIKIENHQVELLWGLQALELPEKFSDFNTTLVQAQLLSDVTSDCFTFSQNSGSEKTYYWSYRISGNPLQFVIASFTSKQKYLEFDPYLLNHCGSQLTIIHQHSVQSELIDKIRHYDPLTQLCTKPVFEQRLQSVLDQQKLSPQKVAVLALNIVNMTAINSQYSIESGNQLIKQVASEIAELLRSQDSICRYGGDGFLLYLVAPDVDEAVKGVLERINRRCRRNFIWHSGSERLRFHVGYTIAHVAQTSAEKLIHQAEIAVKQAKKQGAPVQFDPSMQSSVVKEHRLDIELSSALSKNEFCLFYQPIVDLNTGKIVKAEALIRWQKGNRLIPPVEFIPFLENSELMIPVGRWVIKQALTDLKSWQLRGANFEKVGVNLSARQFADKTLPQWISNQFNQLGLSGQHLVIEVTESLSLESSEQVSVILEAFSQLGIEIALDDFGTGYSSLSYLHRYPFAYLKIDRAFVTNLNSGHKSYKLFESIVALSQALELTTIAEGIETSEIARLLSHLGVNYGQGYYYSKPVAAEAFFQLIDGSNQAPHK